MSIGRSDRMKDSGTRPAAPVVAIDLEAMLGECVPGGDTCDPQTVADNIRDYFMREYIPIKPAVAPASAVGLLVENLRMIGRIADHQGHHAKGALRNIGDVVTRVLVDYEAALAAPAVAPNLALEHFTTLRDSPDTLPVAKQIYAQVVLYLEAAVAPASAVTWPHVNGIGRDDPNEPRCLSLYFATKPTDDDMRNIHDYLNGRAIATTNLPQIDSSLVVGPSDAQPTEKIVAWWNGLTPTADGTTVPSISWDGEDEWHDIPLIAGMNPCNLAQPAQAVTESSLEAVNRLTREVERWIAAVAGDGSLAGVAASETRQMINLRFADILNSELRAQSRSDNGASVTDAMVKAGVKASVTGLVQCTESLVRDILEAGERARHSAQADVGETK
jgi:hypothetical protein